MKTNYILELAKMLGFIALGYWGFIHFNSALYALPLAMMGSGIVHLIYKLGENS
jgi:hypothetical protein